MAFYIDSLPPAGDTVVDHVFTLDMSYCQVRFASGAKLTVPVCRREDTVLDRDHGAEVSSLTDRQDADKRG